VCGLASLQPRILGILECAAASAAQTKLRATEGAQLRLKTYVIRHGASFQFLRLMSPITVNASSFKKAIYEVCQSLNAKVLAIYEPEITPNFYSAEIQWESGILFIICSRDDDWAISKKFQTNVPQLEFIDVPEFVEPFRKLLGISVHSRTSLMAPHYNRETTDEKYWQPATLGEALFNWWD